MDVNNQGHQHTRQHAEVDHFKGLADNLCDDSVRSRAKGDTNADLSNSTRHVVVNHAVNADRCEQEKQRTKNCEQPCRNPPEKGIGFDVVGESTDVEERDSWLNLANHSLDLACNKSLGSSAGPYVNFTRRPWPITIGEIHDRDRRFTEGIVE